MKLFEYMASGTPIVASDLPSLREVLDTSNSFLFEPDNAASLASEIESVFKNGKEADLKAMRAFDKIQFYSWNNRAKKILKFLI